MSTIYQTDIRVQLVQQLNECRWSLITMMMSNVIRVIVNAC